MRDILGFLSFVFLILFSLFMVWFGLRSYGLNQPVSTYQTPLVQKLIRTAPSNWQEQSPSFQWVFTHYDDAKGWLVPEEDKETLLQDYLSQHKQPLLLFYSIEDAKALPALREIIKTDQAWERTVFCSRQDGSLKDLRELEPKWTFCSGEVFMTRALAFSSLGLESLLDISADVLFIHLNQLSPTSTFHTLIKEAKRKNKLVIMGPVSGPLEGFTPHGWMVVP